MSVICWRELDWRAIMFEMHEIKFQCEQRHRVRIKATTLNVRIGLKNVNSRERWTWWTIDAQIAHRLQLSLIWLKSLWIKWRAPSCLCNVAILCVILCFLSLFSFSIDNCRRRVFFFPLRLSSQFELNVYICS